MDRLIDVDGKDIRLSGDAFLLVDAELACALLALVESTNIEEHRFRAILKADQVVKTINQYLPTSRLEHTKRATIEKARDDLQVRLERVAVTRRGLSTLSTYSVRDGR